ncbi:hypothetical protein SAMN05443247_02429 [Bradyrhizobium erythrophlei]|jgi:hypothetical protein|nr:hypothetical protein SAMN05443247_02429 [Bradyrhizobium erythrophlei]
MTDLRPYHAPPPNAPLTAGARFIRGFKRIGVVLGAITLIVGFAVTIGISIDAQRSAERRFESASCMSNLVRTNRVVKMKTYDQAKIDFEASGCPSGPFYYESLSTILSYAAEKPAPLEYTIEPFGYGALATTVMAAVLFYGFWLLGWLCAGFTRD